MAEISVTPRLHRVAETSRATVTFRLDGREVQALAGDSVLTAALTNGRSLRVSEFGDGDRAGFCMMGACQDCWMWTEQGERLRACTTPVAEGMALSTVPVGEGLWPRPA